jgi:membrane protein DedA with SNARE-associated domain
MHETSQHIPSFIKTLEPLIHKHGYLAVGGLVLLEDFGLPVPGETILIAAAFYAGLGQLNIFLVAIVGFLAAVLGDNIGFAIGSFGGRTLIDKIGKYIFLTPKRIDSVQGFFKRQGAKVIVVARFIDGLRQANGIIAGIGEMSWRRFLPFNLIGAGLWVAVWCSVGYFGGNHIETFVKYDLYLTSLVAVLIIIYIMKLVLKRRHKSEA